MTESSFLYPLGLLITLVAAWLVFRVIVRRDYRINGSLSVLSTTLEFLLFGLHANLPYLYLSVPWPQLPALPGNPIQTVLGLAVLSIGLLATLAIMAHLGYRTTIGSRPDQLRQSGPYRWTRNPQLLTYGVTLLGFLILYPSWQAAAMRWSLPARRRPHRSPAWKSSPCQPRRATS